MLSIPRYYSPTTRPMDDVFRGKKKRKSSKRKSSKKKRKSSKKR